MSEKVSLRRIVLRDWPSTGLFVFASLSLSLVVGTAIYGRLWNDVGGLRFAFYFATLIVAPICLVWGWIVVRRIRLIARLLAHGPRVAGRIVSLGTNSEDIGHAVVAYHYLDQSYVSKITTESFRPGFAPQPGDEVELLVDPQRPNRAFFVKMFAL